MGRREKTPTQLSMELLEDMEYTAQVVEHKLKGGRTKDLFGCIDIVAAHPQYGILGIQATDSNNHMARVHKCRRSTIHAWLAGGAKLRVWSWKHFESFATKPPELRAEEIWLKDLEEK